MPPSRQGWRGTGAVIAIMVFIFAMVVLFREPIRVRWWGYRLLRADTPAERLYYTKLLASRRGLSYAVATRLLQDPDAGLRSHGIVILNAMQDSQSLALLTLAAGDSDRSISRSAMLGIAARRSPEAVTALGKLIDLADEPVAMFATSCLQTAGTPEAHAKLCELATSCPSPGVRAQAIESLQPFDDNATIDALIECLDDDAVFAGMTVIQEEAVSALGPSTPTRTSEPASQPVAQTIGQRAAHVLQALTGKEFGYLGATAPSQRSKAINAWRAWRDANRRSKP